MNIEKCIKQIVKAQQTLDEIEYVYRGAFETDITEMEFGIALAEQHLKAAKAAICDE